MGQAVVIVWFEFRNQISNRSVPSVVTSGIAWEVAAALLIPLDASTPAVPEPAAPLTRMVAVMEVAAVPLKTNVQ